VRIPVLWLRRFHATMTVVWLLLVVPTLLWWRESIPWLAVMSVWANVAGHFGSWQGARAEDAASD
jgi:hypothetical protein